MSIIKDLCQKESISVRKLAEKIDIKPSSLQSAIDNNSTTLTNLEKIANFFGVSVGIFFEGADGLTLADAETRITKLENTLYTIFYCDKDLIINEWNIITRLKNLYESEDEVRDAWVGLRKMVYASIEKIKSLEVVNLCVRLRNIQPTDELSDFEYRENFDNYIYYELADWVWLLGILNGGDCDKTLTKILYKDSRYLNADLHFTNDR
ncbi:MAG: helix-turn-helix transcriptional regulator [Bacteroidales bacterium]|nr:helix-turn-helix transcriptional regulator [Bacteroidales bacterium]